MFNCAKGGTGQSGKNVGDARTCSMLVSIWAATIPNSSRAAPTKSVFVCIFITGEVGSKGDKRDFKKQCVYSKDSSVCHTGMLVTLCLTKLVAIFVQEIAVLGCCFFFAQNVLMKIENTIKCYCH